MNDDSFKLDIGSIGGGDFCCIGVSGTGHHNVYCACCIANLPCMSGVHTSASCIPALVAIAIYRMVNDAEV